MNNKVTYINLILKPEEKDLIIKASKKLSLAFSSYSRMVVLDHAKNLLKNEGENGATG